MTPNTAPQAPQTAESPAALSPAALSPAAPSPAALLAGTIELASDDEYHVRLLHGTTTRARLAPGVQRDLVLECLASRRIVLLAPGPAEQAVILGALQTARSPEVDANGELRLKARRIRVEADEDLRLDAGRSRLELTEEGRLRIKGERMTMHVTANLRVHSALVELP